MRWGRVPATSSSQLYLLTALARGTDGQLDDGGEVCRCQRQCNDEGPRIDVATGCCHQVQDEEVNVIFDGMPLPQKVVFFGTFF